MKLLLENWRKYVTEQDNLEQNVYSFDFDNTLIRYKTLEDGDVVYYDKHAGHDISYKEKLHRVIRSGDVVLVE